VVNRAGRDPADRLLALAVALLPAARQDWGRAMRAEQAHIGSGQDRWRFAVGCLRVALWQGPLWRVAGSLAAQAGAIFVTVASGLTGSFAVEVVGLVLVLPPASWWLGRRTGYFGQSGVSRAARIGRRVGLGAVAAALVVTIGFMTTHIQRYHDNPAAAAVFLGIVVVLLAGYLIAVLAVTSARSTVSAAVLTWSAAIGAGAGLVGFALVPFNEPLALSGAWLAVYPAVLAVPLVGAPAAAGLLAARRGQDGVLAGGCVGASGALVATLIGGAGIWLRPDLIYTHVINKGTTALQPDVLDVAGRYLLVLAAAPLVGLAIGAIGGRLVKPVLPVLLLLLAGLLGYPLIASLNAGSTPDFGRVGATSVAFTPDGRVLLTGADGGLTSSLWNLTDPNHPVRTASVNGPAVLTPDGRTMAARNQIWDVTDPAHPTPIATFTGFNPVAFSPDGHLLATATKDLTTTLWRVTDRARPTRIATFPGGDQGTFSPDGATFAASSGYDSTMTTTLWSTANGTRIATIPGGGGAVFAPDGRTLATRAGDGTVLLWQDPLHPQQIATLVSGQDPRSMAVVVFSPDGGTLATASEDGTVKLWDTADLRKVTTLTPAPGAGNQQIGLSDTHTVAAFAPDGSTFTAVMGNYLAMTWTLADPGRPVVRTRQTVGAGVVAISPDLTSVAGTAPDGSNTVALWHIR
jgi:WD40 repeat protein